MRPIKTKVSREFHEEGEGKEIEVSEEREKGRRTQSEWDKFRSGLCGKIE